MQPVLCDQCDADDRRSLKRKGYSTSMAYTHDYDSILHRMDELYVIAVLNNPIGWHRRTSLLRNFVNHMADIGARLILVELAYKGCAHQSDALPQDVVGRLPYYDRVLVHADTVLWHKENLINIGLQHLPKNASAVCWIDADITFLSPNILEQTMFLLQRYDVVQMWTHANDMGPRGEVMQTFKSFASCYRDGLPYHTRQQPGYPKLQYWHPGFAWAATVDVLNKLGGVLDIAILGSGDHHMACCFYGFPQYSLPEGLTDEYRNIIFEYGRRCKEHVGGVFTACHGTIVHAFHGQKSKRKYSDRWKILKDAKFRPSLDIRKNTDGVYEIVDDLAERKPITDKLKLQILSYFEERDEDATTD